MSIRKILTEHMIAEEIKKSQQPTNLLKSMFVQKMYRNKRNRNQLLLVHKSPKVMKCQQEYY